MTSLRLGPWCALLLAAALPAQRDNVLILLADDIGVDAIGAYGEGADPPPTPHLDALAARGVLFRNAWSNPLCSPTRALIHTGRYALRTGIGTVVRWNALPSPVLSMAEVTLPELLDAQAAGYAHAAIGKWHLTNIESGAFRGPNLAGWSHFAGSVANPVGYFDWSRTVNGATAREPGYMTTVNVDDALAWITSVEEPWLCYLAFFSAHRPFHAPPAHLHTRNLEGLDPTTDPVPFFKAMVEAMDAEIGRLLAALGPDVQARTNVVFLGDNGTDWPVTEPPFVVQHAKGTVYEGGVNVPLIAAGPAVLQPGREEGALVSAVDLFATTAELCGVAPAPPFVKTDSVSLLPHLREPGHAPVRSTVYAELLFPAERLSAVGLGPAAIRDARHKLIRHFDVEPPRDELYDLAADPFEQSDLLAGPGLTPEQQAAYAALAAEMTALRDTTGRIERFGRAACDGSNGRPALAWTGTPAAGSSYAIKLRDGATARPVVLLLGASRSSWGGVALPFPLSAVGGGPGCEVYASGEGAFATVTDAVGEATVAVAVPNLPTLVAATVHHTWLIVDPEAPNNALGITASDAASAVLGSASGR